MPLDCGQLLGSRFRGLKAFLCFRHLSVLKILWLCNRVTGIFSRWPGIYGLRMVTVRWSRLILDKCCLLLLLLGLIRLLKSRLILVPRRVVLASISRSMVHVSLVVTRDAEMVLIPRSSRLLVVFLLQHLKLTLLLLLALSLVMISLSVNVGCARKNF